MRALRITLVLLTTGHLLTQHVFAQVESTQLNSPNISSVEVIPSGVIAGEFDGKIWQNPFNGIWISKNLGKDWRQLALHKRGVTNLEHHNNKLYATTYYIVDGNVGLFISQDNGITFEAKGPSVSASDVAVTDQTTYLGSYSHGLWISKDENQTWTQVIGDGSGVTGPRILHIEAKDNTAIAITPTDFFISKDSGHTWNRLAALSGYKINCIHFKNNEIFIGTDSNGLYTSSDLGATWQEIPTYNNKKINAIYSFKNRLYVQAEGTKYMRVDNGSVWEILEDNNTAEIIDTALLFSYPSYFFMSIQNLGVYREAITPISNKENRFLEIPWDYKNQGELVDKITSYFDHQYPLGGYSYHQENQTVNETTLNFLGLKEKTPLLYYSGHNGTDFALNYGTNLKAPADGVASYYYCNECGHSIKIDHNNGYQTVFMHLKYTGLITYNAPVQVSAGDTIGKVGMTGNTTGPHLHFAVMKDVDGNGLFDDFPDGMVDPFGWKNPYNVDPWSVYTWMDIAGDHRGSESSYLWSVDLDISTAYVHEPTEFNINNKKVIFDLKDEENPVTALVSAFIKPNIPFSQIELDYVEGTSLSITALDHQERSISTLDTTVTLIIQLDELNLQNIIKETLKIYYWDPIEKKWKAIKTTYDYVTNIVSADTKHLSHFVVLGERKDAGYEWRDSASINQANFSFSN